MTRKLSTPHDPPAAGAATSGAQWPVEPDSLSELFEPEPPLSETQAAAEARRCLQCFDPPCQQQCPAGIAIPRFIRMLRSGNRRGAAEVVRSANPLADSCGVACPDEHYCAAVCTRGQIDEPILIRRLHRYATSGGARAAPRAMLPARSLGQRVAVVGAGPAGLSCAFELQRAGVAVVLYEERRRAGGVLAHAIPRYRFPDETITGDLRWIRSGARDRQAETDRRAHARPRAGSRQDSIAGLEIRCGEQITDLAALARSFDAVCVAPGAIAHQVRLVGADLRGVSTALEFLELSRRRRYRNRVGRRVVVIGGGNIAVDGAMAAVRCNLAGGSADRAVDSRARAIPEVHLVYRRSRAEMPAWERELLEAERAGVQIHLLEAPVRILGSRGRVSGIRLQKMRLGRRDASGRPAPQSVPGTEFELPCDQVLLATGTGLSDWARGLPHTRTGWLRTDARTRKVQDRIYAAGDATGAEQSIVSAVRDGKSAARAIVARLRREA